LASLVLELPWRRGDFGSKAPPLQEKLKWREGGRWEKILGWVTRRGESESDVLVGVTLEVWLHRFKKKLKWW